MTFCRLIRRWSVNIHDIFPMVKILKLDGLRRDESFKRNLVGRFSIRRLIRFWNELPEETLVVNTITTLKQNLDRYWKGRVRVVGQMQ